MRGRRLGSGACARARVCVLGCHLFLRLSSRRLGSCLSLLDGGELLGRVGRLRWSLCTPLLSLLLLLLLLPTAPPAALLLLAAAAAAAAALLLLLPRVSLLRVGAPLLLLLVPVPLRIAPLLRSVSSSHLTRARRHRRAARLLRVAAWWVAGLLRVALRREGARLGVARLALRRALLLPSAPWVE